MSIAAKDNESRRLAYVVMFAAFVTRGVAQNLDNFGSGQNAFVIEFVTIGHAGNAADTEGDPNPAGAVGYVYRIGKFEISEDQVSKAVAAGGLRINHSRRGASKPATALSWLHAAVFVNWLNISTGNHPAYKLIPPVPPFNDPTFHLWEPGEPGYNPENPYRNRLAKYVIPSLDEWYKAAYYDPQAKVYYEFPTGRNSAPAPVASGTEPDTAVFNQSHQSVPADVNRAGGLSSFGTMGQGGNAFEWNESPYFFNYNDPHATRIVRGGDYSSFGGGANDLRRIARSGWTIWGGGSTWGLRVAAVTTDTPTEVGSKNPPDSPHLILGNAYPNPTRGLVTFAVSLPTAGIVSVRIFDAQGRLVDTVFTGALPAGMQVLTWNPYQRNLATGMYFIRLNALGQEVTRRLVLRK
jgi:formylglycine-generating enzyme required for sulfatase activity